MEPTPPKREISEEERRLVEKFWIAVDLHRTGVMIMRQNIRRKHPELSPEEVDARLQAWLERRPGAERGDGPSDLRPREWR